MKRRTVNFILISAILIVCAILLAVIGSRPKLLIYNAEQNTIYYKGNSKVLLENVLNPSMVGRDTVMAIFTEPEPLVGIYDMPSGAITPIVSLELLGKEELSQPALVPKEPMAISFISDNILYEYQVESGETKVLWEFTGPISENAYKWLDDSRMLVLDEHLILDDWKLLELHVETGETTLVDTYVSAFDISEDGIFYSRKYYMGSWCEWELHFLNRDLKVVKEPERNMLWEILGLFCGEDGKLYVQSDSGTFGKVETKIYRITNLLFRQKKIAKLDSGEEVLTVKASGAVDLFSGEKAEASKPLTTQEYLYGTWRIEKSVLKSEMYTGTTLDGGSEEDLYDPKDYIGLELEYSPQLMRLGTAEYAQPKYSVEEESIESINSGGDFKTPDIYGLIADEEIPIFNEEAYNSITDALVTIVKIDFEYEVAYDGYDFIPVGTQVILLNEDTMLLGLWGEILMAHRIK